jgi:uncharacterized protein with NRDE domain
MCSIFLAYEAHPRYRLIVAANRDEFYERPTAQAEVWEDAPDILAGRDLKIGGTWLGITRGGRLAAVTNYRDPSGPVGDLSRGLLVSDYLREAEKPEEYLRKVERQAARYSGFNLVVGDKESLWYFSNREMKIKTLDAGVYGLSNHLLDTSWPKVVNGKKALNEVVQSEEISVESVFAFLADKTKADDALLPNTGVGIEKERWLSPIFIVTPIYGTRSSTVVLFERDGKVSFTERTFQNGVFKGEEVSFQYKTRTTTEARP